MKKSRSLCDSRLLGPQMMGQRGKHTMQTNCQTARCIWLPTVASFLASHRGRDYVGRPLTTEGGQKAPNREGRYFNGWDFVGCRSLNDWDEANCHA